MVTPYIGAYLKIAKYTTPGRSIRYSQGLRRIPRSRPRRRRRGVAAVLTSSSSASGAGAAGVLVEVRSEEHTSELQSRGHLVCRLLLEKKRRDKTKFERNHHDGYC